MTEPPGRFVRLKPAALITTTLLAVSGFPSILASQLDPEIVDASGDANPAAFFWASNPLNSVVFQNLTAYDIEQVYVLVETEEEFVMEFRVRDLPDRSSAPAALKDLANLTQPAVQLVANFTILGVTYEAAAKLAMPGANGLVDTYALRRAGGATPSALSGSYNVDDNTVLMVIPKALVGSPTPGATLHHYRAEGRFGVVIMDFAPSALDAVTKAGLGFVALPLPSNDGGGSGSNPDPSSTPDQVATIVLNTLQGQRVVQPTYGRNYTFGNYLGADDLQLSIGDDEQIVEAGASVTYQITVKNAAANADHVWLTTSEAGRGFAHRLSDAEVSLNAGQEKTVTLTVSTSAAAQGPQLSVVYAVSQLGASELLGVTTSVAGVAVPLPASSSDAPPASDEGEEDSGGHDSPGLGLPSAILLGLLAAWWIRRRQA